jgi:phosphoribosylanthranilate isomerase
MAAPYTPAVKICGITNLDDALAACDAGADALGFLFAEEGRKRNRFIEPDAALSIIQALPSYIMTVGVVVNDSWDTLQEYLEIVDRLQLHGEESQETCALLGHKAIKAFRAGPAFSIEGMVSYETPCYLLDAWVPDARGGTGKTCDWDVAKAAVATGKSIILAGGLTPEKVGEAVQKVRPYAVDVSGGVESAPGKKDHERIKTFVHNAKTSLAG